MFRQYCAHGCGNYLVRASHGNYAEFVCPECRDIEEMDQLDAYWTAHQPQDFLKFNDAPKQAQAKRST